MIFAHIETEFHRQVDMVFRNIPVADCFDLETRNVKHFISNIYMFKQNVRLYYITFNMLKLVGIKHETKTCLSYRACLGLFVRIVS